MPVKSSRTKRYNSEYKSHYKQFSTLKRPDTVKGEITRSVIPYDQRSHVSTPRAGLQSIQLGVIHEPPLQRKKIVPYEKNHNIFATGTIKELSDREWLNVEETARNNDQKNHIYSSKPKGSSQQKHVSPLLVAEKKLLKSAPAKVVGYNYVPDGVNRRSTYTQDFATKGRKMQAKTHKQTSPHRKPKPAIGGTKTGVSPDRLPAAGIRTTTSIGDKRLIQPSDNSDYLRSPEKNAARVFDSEYSSRFKFINGAWIESPELQGRPNPANNTKNYWYQEAISRRNDAYGYSHRARGTHFSREELDHQNRQSSKYEEDENYSVSAPSEQSSRSAKKNDKASRNKYNKKEYKTREVDRPPVKKDAWVDRPYSPVESSQSYSTTYTEASETENGQFILERGRSPTPELREVGQSRRHHYDMTTNILNEKLEKSLTFSPERKKSQNQNGFHKTSLSTSIKSQDGSYVPAARQKQDYDMMSERSMTSRASTASETLERARNRRDHFWSNQNKELE